MKNENRHIDEIIDCIIDEPLVPSGYQVSGDFVNSVIQRIDEVSGSGVIGKHLKLAFKVAASVAVIFFITNLLVLISSLEAVEEEYEVVNEWTGNQEQSVDWYEYYTENRLQNQP